MHKTLILAAVTGCLLGLLTSCTSTPKQERPAQTVGNTSASPAPAGSESVNAAKELLTKGDFKGAITMLENIAKTQEPMTDELKYALIDAHVQYLGKLTVMRTAPMDLLNRVTYSHASRILQLQPDHAEALATKNAAITYFTGHQMTPPQVVDPVLFLEDLMATSDQTGGQSTPAPGSEP
jgi:hypothetical protein